MNSNQRRFERFDIFERAYLVWPNGEKTSVILIDVSLGGAQVLARDRFPDGADCKLQVGQGDDATTLSGAVRYCKPGDHDLIAVGFRHTAADPTERIAIANLVNRIFMNPTESMMPPAKIIEDWILKPAA